MQQQHFTETEIQDFLFEKWMVPAVRIMHLQDCAVCKTRVRNYELILGKVSELPSLTISAGLEGAVWKKVQAGRLRRKIMIAGLSIVSLLACLLPFILFGNFIKMFIASAPGLITYLIAVPVFVFVLFQVTDLISQHRKRIHLLDFPADLQH